MSDFTTSRAFITHASEFMVGDYLPKIERCLEKLTDAQIWWRANEESNSIGNLILHLCGNARQWIICGVGAQPDHGNTERDRGKDVQNANGAYQKTAEVVVTRLVIVPATLSRLFQRLHLH